MIPTFDHLYFSSVKETLDHLIVKKLNAFKTAAIPLKRDMKDDRMSGYTVLSSSDRQWLYNSGIAGTTIANSSQFAGTDWENAHIDYHNGRIILPGTTTDTPPISVNASVKHFNVYTTTKSDEELFNHFSSLGSDPKADSYFAPCYFIRLNNTFNEGLAFGGLDKTYFDFTVSVFTRSEFELMAIGSVFRDIQHTISYMITETPLNEFYDLKAKPWSLEGEIQSAIAAGNKKIHFDEITFSPLKSDLINNKFNSIYIGIARVKTFVARRPRE